MKLGISSAAAPDDSLVDLVEACRRRGLSTLELKVGDAHGIHHTDADRARDAIRRTTVQGVTIAAVASDGSAPSEWLEAIRTAAIIRVPAVLAADTMKSGEMKVLAGHATDLDVRLLFLHRGSADQVKALADALRTIPAGSAGLAWEIDPDTTELDASGNLIAASGLDLAYIRLRGGGPESHGQNGLGIGSLIARLAIARYHGPLILTPSTARYRRAWAAWLGRQGGWGCGSKQSDPSLVTLSTAQTADST